MGVACDTLFYLFLISKELMLRFLMAQLINGILEVEYSFFYFLKKVKMISDKLFELYFYNSVIKIKTCLFTSKKSPDKKN